MYRFLSIFSLLVLVLDYGQCQLGALIPAIQAGSAVMNLLPPSARECVNKVTTKAVSDSLVSKLASGAGSLLGSASPTITRDPGTFYCDNNNQPFYKETARLKMSLGSIPIDLPVTTTSNLGTCFQNGLPNPCNMPLFKQIINANAQSKPEPKLTVGGRELGAGIGGGQGPSSSSGGGGGLASLLGGGGGGGGGSSSSSSSSSSGSASGNSGSSSGGLASIFGGSKSSGSSGGGGDGGSSSSGGLGSLLGGGNKETQPQTGNNGNHGNGNNGVGNALGQLLGNKGGSGNTQTGGGTTFDQGGRN